jgi:hypothetical protein
MLLVKFVLKQKKNRSINNTKGLDILTQLDPKLIQHHGSFAKKPNKRGATTIKYFII